MRTKYKIAFCGAGSIGRRHILNTASWLANHQVEYEIHLIRSGKGSTIETEIAAIISSVMNYDDDLESDFDIIFITNPTSLHFDTIRQYSTKTKAMFIEKPVFDRTDFDLASLQLKSDGIYYVACPLRYTNVYRYIKEHVACQEAFSVRAICSSYLPEWRTGSDYRASYSAHKDMGGGVAIDLIHEWDYLTSLFGCPDSVIQICGKYSGLEIDSDDLAVYIGQMKDRLIELHLDYFGRQSIREMQIMTREDTIEADFINSTVRYLKSGFTVDLSEERNSYQMREIEHFFDIINGICPNDNDIGNAIRTLKISKGEWSQ